MKLTFADLGLTPLSNAFVRPEDRTKGEFFYPLRAVVCEQCWLAQLADVVRPSAHFHDDYVYFSSYSTSWVEHARVFADSVCNRFKLDGTSRVMEIASNDGYLLQHFVAKGIACLGIEPSSNTARAAREKGIDSREIFFGVESAAALSDEGWRVDLLVGNNVLAHVPDINDFVGGFCRVLKPEGVVTLEFPHLLRLLEGNQFDTLYHEHYSYLSLTALLPIFERAGLRIFDVEHLDTHGGSLRLYASLRGSDHPQAASVAACLNAESTAGLADRQAFVSFEAGVRETKWSLLAFLIEARRSGKSIVAYGAAAKGNTLLNYCGIGCDLIDYVVDLNPTKQGRLLPGSRIPVRPTEAVFESKPDYVLILPWNLRAEIVEQMRGVREWGGKFVVPIPRVEVLS